eukprot:COSAG05_NODE_411_length_10106_cov_31.037873_5_plen_254_part_00
MEVEEEVQEISEEIVEDMWCAVAAARCGWRGWTSAIERARHYMRAVNSHATSAAVLNVAVEDYCTRFEVADLQEKARLVPQLRAQAQAAMDGVDAALATTTVATPKTQQEGMTNAGKRKCSDVLAGTNKQHLSDTEGTKGGQQDELPPPLPSPHQQQGQKRELVAERKKKKRKKKKKKRKKKKKIVSEVMSADSAPRRKCDRSDDKNDDDNADQRRGRAINGVPSWPGGSMRAREESPEQGRAKRAKATGADR